MTSPVPEPQPDPQTAPAGSPDAGADSTPSPVRLLARGGWREISVIRDFLRTETVGGALLLVAAVAAVVLANSGWHDAYETVREAVPLPDAGLWHTLHLDLSLAEWASDGLLAIFFLVAGIELKREFVAGDLADRSKAALPIAAALCGVALPALIFTGTAHLLGGEEALTGWAIPTATDIAFALAVLAVIGTHLPSALRSFLLTLAVVDDLVAIVIIALFYTSQVQLLFLAAAIVPLALWRWLLVTKRISPPLLAIAALAAWTLVHASGVHATVAGVLLGLLVPCDKALETDPVRHSLAERVEHRLRPFSAGVAVPVFAFFAAGVTVVGGSFTQTLRDPLTVAVIVGLVAGKALGVFGGTWFFARFTRARLDDDLDWTDVLGLSLLTGVGFTVSLLIGELAFGTGSEQDDHVKVGVLLGSIVAAALASIVLRLRNRHYVRLEQEERAHEASRAVPTGGSA